MKSNKIITIIFLCLASYSNAQDRFLILLENIEENNTTLQALRKQVDAEKVGNRTGIQLPNPEIELGYLWGSPKDMGNRTDINITQSFDFPTAYHHKSKLADGKDEQVDLNYRRQSREILLRARLICVELIYYNRLKKELKNRSEYAGLLFESYKKRFEKGDIDVLEYNKSQLNRLNAEKNLQRVVVEMTTLQSELQQLNGGREILLDDEVYPDYAIPADFDAWFDAVSGNIPDVQIAQKETKLSEEKEKLQKALNLPKLSTGYTSERISGTTLQGLTVGVSVPLWENKNTVKYQKRTTLALKMQYQDVLTQNRNELKRQYDKSFALSRLLQDYSILQNDDHRALLEKSFLAGQLTLTGYILELSAYYETVDQYFSLERDYRLAVAELQHVEES